MKTKPKTALVPKATPKPKESPDNRIYLTKSGERVRITTSKRFPVHPNDPEWRQQMQREMNERPAVVRISDGHELWGCKIEYLTLEA